MVKKLLACVICLTLIITSFVNVFAAQPSEPDPNTAQTHENTLTPVKVTSTRPVILSKGSSSSEYMVDASHTYKAVKILDLYKIMDGENQAVDASGNKLYQYKNANTSVDLVTLLAAKGFTFDPNSGAILATGSGTPYEITDKSGINENVSDAAKLASALAHIAVDNNLPGATFSLDASQSLVCGYYVIYEVNNTANSGDTADGTVATKPILVDIRDTSTSAISLYLKDSAVDMVKTVVSSDADNVKQTTVEFGDTVDYKIVTTFPVYEANALNAYTSANPLVFRIEDTLSNGFTLLNTTENPIKVKVDNVEVAASTSGEPVVVNYVLTPQTSSFRIEFNSDFIIANQGKAVEVTYSAKLNNYANTVFNSEVGNKNSATVLYSNNPENPSSSGMTLVDETQVFTFAIDFRKLDGANDQLLAGAKFTLKDSFDAAVKFSHPSGDNNTYIVDPEGTVTEIETGTSALVIKGLDAGTYTLVETETPSGYSKLGNNPVVTLTVETGSNSNLTLRRGQTLTSTLTGQATVAATSAEITASGTVTNNSALTSEAPAVVVRNYKGIVLPGTGSITAIVLMGIGAASILGGGAFITIKRKKED